jgi:Integrase core domain
MADPARRRKEPDTAEDGPVVVGVHPLPSPRRDRHGLLHRRHGAAAPLLRAVLHRTPHPPRPPRRDHRQPTGAWTTQQARNLLQRLTEIRFVVHDGAGQYTTSFDDVFRGVGAQPITAPPITAPPGAPRANAYAERWVRSVRHELLDRTLIWNQQQLRRLLDDYVEHYYSHRPHRSLGQRAPNGPTAAAIGSGQPIQLLTTCAGLINEYRPAA